jgi:putative methyltransferase
MSSYVEEFKKLYPNGAIHIKLETTRGCPYSCTFCDWGGGVGTKVIKKNLNDVKSDIDSLIEVDPSSIYICDANFGLNGEIHSREKKD